MSVREQIDISEGIYFVTFTCFKWLHLFEITNLYDCIYKWFYILKENGHSITGYVLMPNHLHALISFSDSTKNINKIVANGKRFLAYEIVERLKETNNNDLLLQLAKGVRFSDRKKGSLHKVFEKSFDIKECFTEKFFKQKLEYIHWNPCSGKWMLADCPENYLHSSAKYYYSGEQQLFPVTHWMDLID